MKIGYGFIVALLLLVIGCGDQEGVDYGDPVERDLSQILDRDTLYVITSTNSTSYFLYRGEPLGFEYDLVQAFAAEHDLVLRTRVVQNRDSLFHYLNRGEGDLVAARLLPSAIDTPHVRFTEHIYRTAPVVVQQDEELEETQIPGEVQDLIEETPDSLMADVPDSVELNVRLIERPAELAGETVFLARSTYVERLTELSDSIEGDIEVVEVKGDISTEALIRQVATGEITLTVSQQNLAKLQEGRYTNIHVRPVVGESHRVAWAVRRNSPELLQALDDWIETYRDSPMFDNLYRRYFVDRRSYLERAEDEYLTSETGRLSAYDLLLSEYADDIGWDWRLLASQAFQESRFDPNARSWAGATGLLQLMPATAAEFGVRNILDPRENVEGAVRFIQWLTDYWDDILEDQDERMKFILASYNTGHGHVEDARRLTAKNGGDDNTWEDVAFWLLQKSNREVYEDPVVRYGFCRGLEPVTYVAKILDRYDHYREFVADEPVRDEEPVHTTADASTASQEAR